MEYVLDVADSLSNKKWVQRVEKIPYSERLIETVIQKYELPEIIARAVIGRNISLEQIEPYLYPKLKQLLPDPLILKDMQQISLKANRQTMVICFKFDCIFFLYRDFKE